MTIASAHTGKPSGYIGKPLKEVAVAGRKYKLTKHNDLKHIIRFYNTSEEFELT